MAIIIRKKFKNPELNGITVFPFIFINKNLTDEDASLTIAHEKVHIQQCIELLVIFFYLWYGVEYIIRRIRNSNSYQDYKNISFEAEAFANIDAVHLDYYKTRKHYSFLKYLNINYFK